MYSVTFTEVGNKPGKHPVASIRMYTKPSTR